MKRLGSILLALIALAWLLVAGLGFFLVPFYGFRIDFSPEPRVLRLSESVAVQNGDRVLRLNGQPLKDPEEWHRVLREARRSPLSIEVERARRRLEIVQPAVPHSARVVAAQATSILAGLILLAVGLMVGLRPTGKPGGLFFLFCIAVAVLLGGLPDGFGGPALRSVVVQVLIGALVLCGAFLLHFFLVFPRPHPLTRRFPRLERLIYVPPAACLLVIYTVNLIPDDLVGRLLEEPQAAPLVTALQGVGPAAILTLAVYLACAVAAFVSSYRRLEEPMEREKLRWLVWGVAVSMVPTAALVGLEMVAGIRVPWSDVWWPLLLLLLPASFAYAILSHRIMDIEVVLNRGLVYGVVTALLLVVFIAVENLLAGLSLELAGASGFVVAMTAAVVMALLVNPLKARVERLVDRFLFAYRWRLREGLEDLAEEISFVTQLEPMERMLLRRLVDLAEVRRAVLFLKEDEEGGGYVPTEEHGEPWSYTPSGGGAVRLGADDPLAIRLLREGRPLQVEDLPEAHLGRRLTEPETRLLQALEAALVLPLRLRADLIGFLVLSRRRNREPFDRDEVAFLHDLARRATADLANARLRSHSLRLERENATLREDLLGGLRDLLSSSRGDSTSAPDPFAPLGATDLEGDMRSERRSP